jgi:hypothetical protein
VKIARTALAAISGTGTFSIGIGTFIAALTIATNARAATPEPWSDSDPIRPPARLTIGDYGVRAAAEYRANLLYVNPIDLASETENKQLTIEHRLRADATVDWEDKVRLTTSVDVLDGVLWGDNGNYGTSPEPNSGANVNANNVNAARTCIKQIPGTNPADAKSYTLGLCQADYLFVRRLYGEVLTPIGMLRIGRQPFNEGTAVAVSDGDGRRNRFGFANRGNSADRILFATKPLEAFKDSDERDVSDNRGTFLILAYDNLVTDDPLRLGDDVKEWITALRVLEPNLGGGIRDLEGRLFHTYRWDTHNDTAVNAIGGRLTARFGPVYTGFDTIGILGHTREVSQAFSVVTNDPPTSQAIQQFGLREVIRYDTRKVGFYMEVDYASGDSDPHVNTPLTQMRFAEDTNVGLLMFKHVLAYQSARAAAAASAVLTNLNAPTVPAEVIDTRGSFTDAFALFPQLDLRVTDSLLVRPGLLVAWAPAPVIDPIASQQRHPDGTLRYVNFAGGKPGQFYGTELDGRIQYRMYEHFIFDLEGAILWPGDALKDEDGYAARSVMVQGRTTFFF